MDWFPSGTFEPAEPPDDVCPYAAEFGDWADRLVGHVESDKSPWTVQRGYLELARRYWQWYALVPKRHRETVQDCAHRCLFRVFRDIWFRIAEIELGRDPPAFTAPPAPTPPRLPTPTSPLDGLLLGHLEPDPEFDGDV